MPSALRDAIVVVAVATGLSVPALFAEEGAKTLPTLLIKGEVVSVEAGDPAATLLKVKDRYGFETPIFLTPETKITQGEAAVLVADVATGASVEVEYNFDVNTAKRHAVAVKLSAPMKAAEATPMPFPASAVPAAASTTPAPMTSLTPAVQPVAPEARSVASPTQQQPAPASEESAPVTTQ